MENEKIISLGKCVFEFDGKGNITKTIFDKSYAQILGYTEEEFRQIRDVEKLGVHPDDKERVFAEYAEAVKPHPEGYDCDVEYRMITKWGYRWFHDYGHYIRDEQGNALRCDIVIFDINDSKTMNVNLGTIQLSHDVLSKSNIGLWAVELDPGQPGRLYGDEAMMKLIGVEGKCTPEEALHALDDNVDKDHWEEVHEALDKMAAGFHAEVQYPWHYPDGRTIIVRCGGIRNPTYTKGVRIEGVHRDITNLTHYDREKELLEQVKESEKVTESFMKNYSLVFNVNMSDDTFSVLKAEDKLIKHETSNVKYTKALELFTENIVYEKDRAKMRKEVDYENIRKRLSERSTFSVDYRVENEGVTEWHEMTVKALDENKVAVGIANRNKEIILEHLQNKLKEEFYAVFAIDLDTEQVTIVKNAPWYVIGEEMQVLPYKETIQNFAKDLSGDEQQFFIRLSDINYAKRILSTEDKRSYSYKSKIIKDNPWVTVTEYVISRHEDGTPAVFTLGFSILDSLGADNQELQAKLTDALAEARTANERITHQKILLDYFVESYSSAYSVDLINNTYEILHIEKKIDKLVKKNGQIKDIDKFISKLIYPDDREIMRRVCNKDYIVDILREERNFSFTVRVLFDDVVKTMRCLMVRGIDEYHIAVGFLDITEELKKEKEQQRQLEEALSMAESSNRAKTTFLNNMSHDIRTPMNAIIGYTELAANHIDNKEQVKDYLNKISHSSAHLLSLINDVLDMSRIESGKMTIDSKNENLFEIIGNLRDIVQADVQSKVLNFYVDYSDVKDNKVVCDKLRLNQVLLNILSNSIKYTSPGGIITLTIKETYEEGDKSAKFEFRVKDNGIGMSNDFLKTIYDPFTRVRSSTVSGIQGTGLGMAITKNIVDMMNGTIEIDSKLGKGTETILTFNFDLQEAVETKKKKSETKTKNNKSEKTSDISFEGKKVLLVEDNEYNREIASIFLEEYGFVVTYAEDGDIAVKKIKNASNGDFDLILMDIQMPTLDGYEATKQIRALNSEISKIPIIAMTANAFEEDRKMALEAGMNEHIAKPINIDKLKSIITKVFNQ